MIEEKLYEDISVLYVEDDDSISSKIISFFELRVGELHTAKNGAEGLEIYKEHQPDIVVSDVKMPVMNGLDMAREIKKINEEARIIITSAFNDQDFLFSAIEVGVCRYVLKPIKREFMVKALEECVEQIRLKRMQANQREKLQGLLEMQDNIVITTDGVELDFANRAFLNFFAYESVEDFLKEHKCVCEYFSNEKGYLFNTGDGSWLLEVIENEKKGIESKVKMKDQTFLVRYNRYNEDLYVVTFTNISVIEKNALEQEKILVQQGKMAEVGNMIGAIIHQWKQPLNVISILSGSLSMKLESGEAITKEDLEENEKDLQKQIRFMSETMNDFKNFFTPSKVKEEFTLKSVTESVVRLLSFRIKKLEIEIKNEIECQCKVLGYKNELRQVIFNVLNNSFDELKEVDNQEKIVRIRIVNSKESLQLVISDNGKGIEESLLPDKLFEAHLSTKGEQGTGIGLSISKSIIEQRFLGAISAKNRDEGGAEFTISLPKSVS